MAFLPRGTLGLSCRVLFLEKMSGILTLVLTFIQFIFSQEEPKHSALDLYLRSGSGLMHSSEETCDKWEVCSRVAVWPWRDMTELQSQTSMEKSELAEDPQRISLTAHFHSSLIEGTLESWWENKMTWLKKWNQVGLLLGGNESLKPYRFFMDKTEASC